MNRIVYFFSQAYLDKAFSTEIMELEVKCNNYEWGCKWEKEYSHLQVYYLFSKFYLVQQILIKCFQTPREITSRKL